MQLDMDLSDNILQHFKNKLLIKPSWLEIVRFTKNLGERALTIWIDSGYYHFTIYKYTNI